MNTATVDTAHEAKLEAALEKYLLSKNLTELERVKLWAEFVGLHAKRSPERVRTGIE